VLLRARAIDSMIIDPWGNKIADCSDAITYCAAHLDRGYLEKNRAGMPVAQHHVLA
jgi:deaminated glutathione amidase